MATTMGVGWLWLDAADLSPWVWLSDASAKLQGKISPTRQAELNAELAANMRRAGARQEQIAEAQAELDRVIAELGQQGTSIADITRTLKWVGGIVLAAILGLLALRLLGLAGK